MESLKRYINSEITLENKKVKIISFDFTNEKVHLYWVVSNRRTSRDLKTVLKFLDLTQEEMNYFNLSYFSNKKENKINYEVNYNLEELIFEKIK